MWIIKIIIFIIFKLNIIFINNIVSRILDKNIKNIIRLWNFTIIYPSRKKLKIRFYKLKYLLYCLIILTIKIKILRLAGNENNFTCRVSAVHLMVDIYPRAGSMKEKLR